MVLFRSLFLILDGFQNWLTKSRMEHLIYEARTLLGLGVSRTPGVGHMSMSETDTYNYIELCHF
jgi:hypothetical protein